MGGDRPRKEVVHVSPFTSPQCGRIGEAGVNVQYEGGLGEDLKRERDTLAAADAQRDDAALETVAAHRVDQSRRQHGARRPDRMP